MGIKQRGFGSPNLTPERRAELASKGGKAVHEKGTSHEWSSKAAREASRKGLLTRRRNIAARLQHQRGE